MNSTQKNTQHQEWENDWGYLPVIKALTAVASLLHDWGKASQLFQHKLKNSTKQGDPLRHEWISCLLLQALIAQSEDKACDKAWLTLLASGTFDESKLLQTVAQNTAKPLHDLPPIAQLVAWLIVSHHRLPNLAKPMEYGDTQRKDITSLLKIITAEWGYQNKFDERLNKSDEQAFTKRLEQCFEFKQGVLSDSPQWRKALKQWASRLSDAQPDILTTMNNGAWRVIVHHARLCLMLGDHYYSSCDKDNKWQSHVELYANTARIDQTSVLKQKLDEHLVRVGEHALNISQSLARFTTDMSMAYDIKSLAQKSPKAFEWQDTATQKITEFKQNHPQFTQTSSEKNGGW